MAYLTDAQLAGLSILLIDDMALVRQELRSQLAQLGATQVMQASAPDDAIDKLRANSFDLVLCDYNLNRQTDGQQLLEYVRAQGILSQATLFVMVTAEQEYVAVASAAEVLPDDYVLKPFTTNALGERLKALLARQVAFKAVNQHLARKDHAAAAAACVALAGPSSKYQILALRRQAECHLELGQHVQAKALYEQLLALRDDLSWAQLGLAKCLRAANRHAEAASATTAVVEANPQFVQAYDLLADLAEEQGDDERALQILLKSAAVVPSARRSRRVADVAYRAGDLACARENYAAACKLTRGSRTAEASDVLQLSQVHLDEGNAAAAMALLSDPQTVRAARTGAAALATATAALEVRALAQTGDQAGAEAKLKSIMASAEAPQADMVTILLAKANLAVGNDGQAADMLAAVVRGDHDNKKRVGMVRSAMVNAGMQAQIDAIIEREVQGTNAKVKHAEALVRQFNHDGARKCIEDALAETPNNTTVMLAASQITLFWLSKQSRVDRGAVDKIRGYLATLEVLLPGNPRLAMQNKFLLQTITELAAAQQAA